MSRSVGRTRNRCQATARSPFSLERLKRRDATNRPLLQCLPDTTREHRLTDRGCKATDIEALEGRWNCPAVRVAVHVRHPGGSMLRLRDIMTTELVTVSPEL